MANSFNNEQASFTEFPATLASTPAAMSSFLLTQTFFKTTPNGELTAAPPATISDATTSNGNTSKTPAAGKSTSTKPSALTSHTSSTIAPGGTSNTIAASITSPTGSTLSTSFTSPGAASATTGGATVLSEANSCTGLCSPGMQAAVAVPITLIGLGIIIAIIIFARRRRRTDPESAASTAEPRGSKWARHLRVFSFDAELLIGGRSSRATSVRSQPTTRSCPSQTSLHSQQPSLRSLESPAPPYRDALAASGMQMAMRPESQLTAPPHTSPIEPHADRTRGTPPSLVPSPQLQIPLQTQMRETSQQFPLAAGAWSDDHHINPWAQMQMTSA